MLPSAGNRIKDVILLVFVVVVVFGANVATTLHFSQSSSTINSQDSRTTSIDDDTGSGSESAWPSFRNTSWLPNLRFDCRRNGHDCAVTGGLCNVDSGFCDCFSNYTGLDCGYYELTYDDFASQLCGNDGCGPEGVCLLPVPSAATSPASFNNNDLNNGVKIGTCECDYARYGSQCNRPRYLLICGRNDMQISLVPFTSKQQFTGSIYVIDANKGRAINGNITACRFVRRYNSDVANDDGSDAISYTLQLTYQQVVEQCGGMKPANDSYQLDFIVQSDPEWLTAFDFHIVALCSPLEPTTRPVVSRRQPSFLVIVVNVTDTTSQSLLLSPSRVSKPVIGDNLANNPISPPNSPISRGFGSASVKVSDDLTNLPQYTMAAVYDRNDNDIMAALSFRLDSLDATARAADPSTVLSIVGTVESSNSELFSKIRLETCFLKIVIVDHADNSTKTLFEQLIKNHCPFSGLLVWQKIRVENLSARFWLELPNKHPHPRQEYQELTVSCSVKLCTRETSTACNYVDTECTGGSG